MTGSLLQDLRFAGRAFVRVPRFTIPAVLALALGIGATSAIFSVVRGVMLEAACPYRDPDRIVSIWETNVGRGQPRGIVAAANFVAWRERNRSFGYLGDGRAHAHERAPERTPYETSGLLASAEVFSAARRSAGDAAAPTRPKRTCDGQRRRVLCSATSSGRRGSAAGPTCSARTIDRPTAAPRPSSG